VCVTARENWRARGLFRGVMKNPSVEVECRVGEGSLGAQVQKDGAEISLLLGWSQSDQVPTSKTVMVTFNYQGM